MERIDRRRAVGKYLEQRGAEERAIEPAEAAENQADQRIARDQEGQRVGADQGR